jgi:predicted protein tyrosine phosphatase
LERFPEVAANKEISCLDIPDHYAYMEPQLVGKIKESAEILFRTLNIPSHFGAI